MKDNDGANENAYEIKYNEYMQKIKKIEQKSEKMKK